MYTSDWLYTYAVLYMYVTGGIEVTRIHTQTRNFYSPTSDEPFYTPHQTPSIKAVH